MKILEKNQKQTVCCDSLRDRCRKSGGFSLISLSLFIVVLGMFTVGGIALSKQFGWSQKQDAGYTTVAQVEEAMKNYRALNGNLPCPARMDLAPTDTNFGVSDCTSVGVNTVARVAGTRNIPGVPAAQERIKIGSVPVRSLNLPDSAMVDGWGHRLVYAVTEYYTNGSPNFDADRGTIQIVDAQGRDMTPNAQQSVIYAVLTPGAEGRGARSLAGTLVDTCPGSGDTAENCDMNDGKFVSSVLKQFTTGNNSYTANVKYASIEKAYQWEVADWKDCKCASSNPKQDRKTPSGYDTVGTKDGLRCVDQSGTQVADSNCLASTKPKATQSCAAFCWKVKAAPACTCANKGAKLKTKVTCERKFKNDIDVVAKDNCAAFEGYTEQVVTTTCNPTGCGGSNNNSKESYDVDGDGFADTEDYYQATQMVNDAGGNITDISDCDGSMSVSNCGN